MSDETMRPGAILAGKYRVERVLGQGGMGIVVAATHLRLDELVAIKLLLPGVTQNQETIERFAREARAASKIKSEHVARVSDVDTQPDGSTYMVMEYLDGCDLAEHLHERGEPLPVDEAVVYLLQVCEAMAEAHSLGIVHRDLKPENLFLTARRDGSPIVKVLDFGVSKIVDPARAQGLTHTRGIVGSPHYMSPEQLIASRTVDARADIWAVGVTLYQLVTGELPFGGDTLPETCTLVMHAQPARPRSIRPDLPGGLEDVILRCLEKEREARFVSMGELAAALAEFGPPEARVWADRAMVLSGVPSGRMSSLPRSARSIIDESRVGPMADTLEFGGGPTLKATTVSQGGTASGRRRVALVAFAGMTVLGVAALLWRSRSVPVPELDPPTSVDGRSSTPLPSPPARAAASPSTLPLVTPASAEPTASESASPPPSASSARPASTPRPRRWAPPKASAPAAAEDTIGF